jgi:hypothetical protein
MVLGLIPDCDLSKVSAVGNAAGTGARMALVNRDYRREIEETVREDREDRNRAGTEVPGPLRRGDGAAEQDRPLSRTGEGGQTAAPQGAWPVPKPAEPAAAGAKADVADAAEVTEIYRPERDILPCRIFASFLRISHCRKAAQTSYELL